MGKIDRVYVVIDDHEWRTVKGNYIGTRRLASDEFKQVKYYGAGIYDANTGEVQHRIYHTDESSAEKLAIAWAKRVGWTVVDIPDLGNWVPGDSIPDRDSTLLLAACPFCEFGAYGDGVARSPIDNVGGHFSLQCNSCASTLYISYRKD